MLTITFLNVEKLIFLDSKLRNLLPDFSAIFNSWSIAQQSPDLRPMAQKMLINFVNQIESRHLEILSKHFNTPVEVEKLDPNVATHLELSIDNVEDYLNANPIIKEAMFAYREGNSIYISIWR